MPKSKHIFKTFIGPIVYGIVYGIEPFKFKVSLILELYVLGREVALLIGRDNSVILKQILFAIKARQCIY